MEKRAKAQAGFSLIEMMIVILLLSVIMGSVFSQLDLVQKRFRSEQSKMDVVQTAREFIDQMIRDIHQNGFPNIRMYAKNVLTGDSTKFYYDSMYNAVGIVYIDPTQIRFEGDVTGDGKVYAIAYKLFPASTAAGDENCPCIRRSQVLKADGTTPIAQATDYRTQVENLSTTNTNIFSAYDKDGVLVPLGAGLTRAIFDPFDMTNEPVNTIYTLQIQLNVQGATTDIGTSQRPQVFLTATAQLNN